MVSAGQTVAEKLPESPSPRKRAGRRTTWKGGIIRYDNKGRVPRYYIWRKVAGVRYRLSLGVTTEDAADLELKRFERFVAEGRGADYRPGEQDGPERITLDADLVKEFLAFSAEKENSVRWRKQQRALLAWWSTKLAGRDLARVTLDRDILPALDGSYKASRIRVLKALYSWLREVRHRIAPDQDPTYGGRLKAPQAKAAQTTGKKSVRSQGDYRKVWTYLRGVKKAPHWADALIVLAGTGWHLTEVDRFCTTGRILVPRTGRTIETWAILVTPHKNKHEHRTLVSKAVYAAAKRHRRRRLTLDSNKDFYRALRKACRKTKVKKFTPGVTRASVATWAVDAGAALPEVATFLGHKSQATTKKFYATFATPKKVPTLV